MTTTTGGPVLHGNVTATSQAITMIHTVVIATAFIFTNILVAWFLRYKRSSCTDKQGGQSLQRPPVVPGLPLFGNIFQLDAENPHLTLTSWARQYGPVYTIHVFREPVLVICGRDQLRCAVVDQSASFAGRPYFFRIDYGFHHVKDVIFGDYTERWRHLKRVSACAMRTFACGQGYIDEVVREEMQDLQESLDVQVGQDFDPRLTAMVSVVNAITASVLGRRYAHTDPVMLHYQACTRAFSETCAAVDGMELDLFPWLRFLPNKNFAKLNQARDTIDALIDVELVRAKNEHEPHNAKCVLDALMDEQLTDGEIKALAIDLLVSGSFTTSIALSSLLLILVHYPAVQNNMYNEIKNNIGLHRLPDGSDRCSLPYTQAVVYEVLRYISHVPLCLPHKTTQDVTLGGYHVDKDTQVFLNLWALHHDEHIWKEPWKFTPERFLDKDGQLLDSSHALRKSLLPFSAGRRMCLGETLARERLMLFISCILQKFHIEAPSDDDTLTSCDPREFQPGLILEPKPFKLRMSRR